MAELSPLPYREFDDIPVSTKTFIVMTNLQLDINKLFDFLPITHYEIVPKKRGRKKKSAVVDPNKDIADGSIITLDIAGKIKGVKLKKRKKQNSKGTDYFRNSITVVMYIDGKHINFKISRNGKFQMTGCKKDSQAESCIKYIWEYIKDTEDIFSLQDNTAFKAIFIPAMRNIDFNLGFILDREKLDEYFNTCTSYHSLLETSIGYTGVNIKIPVLKPITELNIKELTYRKGAWAKPKYISYQNYLSTLKPKEQEKRISKPRHNTFLVFQSGNVIMSSMCEDFARETYYEFLDIIRKNYKKFEEKLEE